MYRIIECKLKTKFKKVHNLYCSDNDLGNFSVITIIMKIRILEFTVHALKSGNVTKIDLIF